jgi:iron complex outermembrane receptor protein
MEESSKMKMIRKQSYLEVAQAFAFGSLLMASFAALGEDQTPGGTQPPSGTGGTTPAEASTAAPEPVQRVIVTGSGLKHTLEEQALPVQIITHDEIAKSGAINMESLMDSLPAVSAAGGLTRSMGAGISTYGESSISLRGLGANRTLVLMDGRRLTPFALDTNQAVDINAIPIERIERIEVLTDGASSIYGSDAVGGVVNFIMRHDFHGAEVSVDAGQPTSSGGGDNHRVAFIAGKGDLATDRYNFMISGAQETQSTLVAKDRSYAKSGNVYPYYQNGATGSGNIEGIWTTTPSSPNPPGDTRSANAQTGTNPLGITSKYYGNPLADSIQCAQDNHFMLAGGVSAPSTSAGRCFYDSASDVHLIPETKKKDLSGSFTVKLDPQNQFYGNGSWVYNLTVQAIQPSPIRTSFLSSDSAYTGSGVSPALLIRPGNPNYDNYLTPWLNSHGLGAMVGQPIAVTLRTFLAGPRTSYDESTQTRFNFGFKGEFMGWDYDTALSRDQNIDKGSVIDGYFSQVGLSRALNNTTNDWNPWAAGGAQPADVTAAIASATYKGPTAEGTYTTTSWDGRISNNAIASLPAGDVGLSLGAAERHEQFEITVPAILGSGDIAGLGGATSPAAASRQISSVFAETNVPLTTNISANASARYDSYNDLKSDANPVTGKLSARWQPVHSLVFRGSYGTGFRAPSMAELYTPVTVQTTEQYTDPVGGAGYQANSLRGGNPDLSPEKSTQWSLGGVFTPNNNWTMRADYFYIEIRNYITFGSAATLVAAANGVNNAFVTFAPDGTADTIDQRNLNAGTAKFAGVDLGATWNDRFPFGHLTADYNGTLMTKATLERSVGGASSIEDGLGTQVDSNGYTLFLVSNGGTILRYKHKLSLDWTLGDWGATLTQNYTDKYRDGNDLLGNKHYVPAYSIYDVQARYDGIKHLSLSVGARNIFDKQPPLYINTVNFFAYGYDPAQYDPLGRFIYGKATVKF